MPNESQTPTTGTIISSDNAASYVSYQVKTGDTLESIATEYKTSVAILIQLNGLSISEIGGAMITEGQILTVPSKSVAASRVSEYSNNAISSYGQTIHTASTRTITVGHPYAKVEIATETAMLTLNQNLAVTSTNFDGDILALTTSRDLGNDCPTFNLRVVYRHDWYDLIGSNDLVIIELCRPPEAKAAVLFGLVDDIRKTTDFSTGKPVRSFDITGRGFNKALVNFCLGAVTEIEGDLSSTSGLGWMGEMATSFTDKSPVQIIQMILQHYLTNGCDYNFANGTSFLSYYQQYLIENTERPERLDTTVSFLDYQGSLWQLLKEVKNAPFNEMFWEVYNDRPTLVVRPTPFNQNNWNSLERIQIKDSDIISENLGRSDLETYVVYSVKSTAYIGNVDVGGIFPLWYPPFYSKYGINRLQVNSKFLGYGDDVQSVILGKQHDIFNWNIKNNSMENGTITVKGSNQYKIGQRIILESTGMEYYVENVSHNFTLYQSWVTTLSVTRGLMPNNRFTAPWGMGVQMSPSDLSTIYGWNVSGYSGGNGNNGGGTPSGSGGGGDSGGNTGSSDYVALTGDYRQDLVNIALSQKGNVNGQPYWSWYGFDSRVAWCACFVSWCANQAGIPTSAIPKRSACTNGGRAESAGAGFMSYYKNEGRWQPSQSHGGSYTPQAGDVVLFNWSGSDKSADHVGIVVSCENGVITTIEGNSGNAVKTRTYKVTDKDVIGFGTY